MQFIKPSLLNGDTLIKELSEIGIKIDFVVVDENNNLILNVSEKDKSKVEKVLEQHDGRDTIPQQELLKQSAYAKLKALGLTEDEIAAL